MKAWEEDWHCGFGGAPELTVGGSFIGSFYSLHEGEGAQEDMARARLATQAPAMARMLLELVPGSGGCQFCGAQFMVIGREAFFSHAETCRWLLLLKAAGVR